MYLQAGRKAVESKQKLMDQFGGKGLSDSKIELYNEQITQLVLSASATENDAIDDKSANTAGLLELFKTIEYADAESIAVWQELYISKAKPYIDEGHHYYQFCLYDIDKNGIPELMLKPTGARLPGTAYTVNQGGIIGLEGIIWGNLYASRRPQSIVSSGSAGTGMLFTTLYTLNDNKLVEMGKLTYDEHSEDYPDHRFFFNGNKISEKEYERIYSELISEASKLTWEPLDEKTLHYSLTNNSR